MKCPEENRPVIDQSTFWSEGQLNWEKHRIGWTIAGACTVLTVIISFISVLKHCRNYTNPPHQRQILRIIYMPPVYGIISFFSYRFFRAYTYYSLIQVAYEAVTLSAFLLLLIEYVADTAANRDASDAIARKDKTALPFPFCCWRYRPTKAYFMYTLKWSVLQYVIIRPLASIVGIVCEHYEILCEGGGFDPHFASMYLQIIDFISISIALYGLFLFYGLTKEELVGKRPLAKFLAIKLIVMFTFYQSFIFSALEGKVIKGSLYWTPTNISHGLNALAICIEMIFFAALMHWAYTANEYARPPGTPATSIWRPLWDSINYADFAYEIGSSFKFFVLYFSGRPEAHGHGHLNATGSRRLPFAQAFGVAGSQRARAGGYVGVGTKPGPSGHDS